MHAKVGMSLPKISKNNKSFSLLWMVLRTCPGLFVAAAQAETIEILYEQGEESGILAGDWGWLLLGFLLLFALSSGCSETITRSGWRSRKNCWNVPRSVCRMPSA